MITNILLILILALLVGMAYIAISVLGLIIRFTADVESIMDMMSQKTAKDMANKLQEAGYICIKKEE